MRARITVAMSLFIKFDCYLIDELPGVGDARFRKRFAEAFDAIQENASLILVSHSESAIRKSCDTVFVLRDGGMERFDDVDEALSVYREL